MFDKLKRAVFYYNPTTPLANNVGFLILRFFVGLALCTVFEKLFPKNGIWGPQDWFIQDVHNMGFPFPLFFTWAAVLVEFFGGLFLIFGFFTRPAAILNVMVTFVAAFVYHKGDIAQSGLTAFLFMIMCTCIALFGAGKFSLDYLLKVKKPALKIVILVSFLAAGNYLEAQTVAPSDLQQMDGMWKGHLTYTDYKDDLSQTKLDCELTAKWKNKRGIFNLTFIEPNGQIYKDKTKIKLKKRGSQLKFDGKYKIIAFSKAEDNLSWELTASGKGKDNNKDAELKLVIGFIQNQLIMTKFIKYAGSSEFFIRNCYSFDRKNKKQINGEK